jgi:hypothetical protein
MGGQIKMCNRTNFLSYLGGLEGFKLLLDHHVDYLIGDSSFIRQLSMPPTPSFFLFINIQWTEHNIPYRCVSIMIRTAIYSMASLRALLHTLLDCHELYAGCISNDI